ncbi:NDR1/HIN1-like protein 1 [Punica granatum]|uniref:Late embryogenesis abundant protein LEA-2 subgroup domain-containing protein n=2 Tax=Punica granatum TaxID=22663 RepID=A0A218W913_PUNGR|nr:NDR1/HIN1-like protein 1 [Punica granatum]OWM69033.1 hypothetical protein CDL15_Pgr025220 [Punica granatum]PKI73374.1 hypothetical protein CRG98_006312 [Punica granatum]
MTAKDCSHHDEEWEALRRRAFMFLVGLVALVLFIILLVFLVLRPSKPAFILRDATVYEFNATSLSGTPGPNFLTIDMQVTLSSRNPNDRIGIYYFQLDTYVSYRGQQVTPPYLLPDSYQGHKEVIDWSPFLVGHAVPVSPYLGDMLSQDLNAGMVLVNVKLDGKVKWKVGTWISGSYHLHVNCPAMLMLKASGSGAAEPLATGLSMKVQLSQQCTVDV